jgi:signal transduction histidine kinase
MGLGLYICRGIAEQHGGTIVAQSEGVTRGTTIHVMLPIAQPVELHLAG